MSHTYHIREPPPTGRGCNRNVVEEERGSIWQECIMLELGEDIAATGYDARSRSTVCRLQIWSFYSGWIFCCPRLNHLYH